MNKDQRRQRRRPMRHSAWVALGPEDLHGCKLSDVSESGARIEMDDARAAPDRFVLFLSRNGAARRKCVVVWRNGRQIGVKFESQRAASKRAPAPKAEPATNTSEPAESA